MELKAYLIVLQRRWKLTLLVFFAVILLSIVGSSFYSPNYQAETSLRLIPPLGGSLENPYYQTTYANRLMNTYAQIASSELLLNELKEKLGLATLPDIRVTIVPDSEIVQIIVQSSNPVLAAKTANTLAELTISKQKTTIENSAPSSGLSILSNRIDELKSELEKANQKHDELVMNYSQTTAQLTTLDKEIQMQEVNYQNLLIALGPINEEVTALRGEIESRYQEYQDLSSKSNEYLQQITMLRQSIQNDQSAYTNLLLQYDTVQVTNLIQVSTENIQIVSPAVPPSTPTGFSKPFVLGLGILCGLIASVVSAFVFDNLDTRLYSPEQIENVISSPVIGTISEIRDLNKQDLYLKSESPILLRDSWILGTKILRILHDSSIKSILVTSSNPGEGKSTVISAIANVLAQNDCKVLVVDADVHKLQQYISINVADKDGLNAFLRGSKNNIKEVIQTDVKPNIDLLPSLVETDDPAKLFRSSQLDSLFEQVKKYDVVLVDAPALSIAPDAYKLAVAVDCVLIVAQRGSTTVNDIQSLYVSLESIGSKFLGVVMNQIPRRRRAGSNDLNSGRFHHHDTKLGKTIFTPFYNGFHFMKRFFKGRAKKSPTKSKISTEVGLKE